MMNHLLRNNLIRESQHGLMNNKSCCTNLLEFLESATKAVDNGEPFDVVFLDFAKAFDKVPRERLLAKLRGHGIHEGAINWIRAWLTDRMQRVVLNGCSSTWKEVLSGVPQGSVLGPLLFLVFINDLDETTGMVSLLKKFADDTKLGQPAGTQQERERLQEALSNLCEWADKWCMSFNVSKCRVMHLGRGNVNQVPIHHEGGTTLQCGGGARHWS